MAFDRSPTSVRPWMLEWPRSAFMPPPATPMLPSSSCTIAIVRMFCEPTECCVQPSANRLVSALSGAEHEANSSQICRNFSCGVPQMRDTISRRVAVDVLAQEVDDAARILPRVVDLGEALIVLLVVPARLVVGALLFVVSGEEPVLEAEAVLHDEAGVGVGAHVFVLDLILFEQIADDAAQESDVRARTDRGIDVGDRRGAGEARVDDDELGAVLDLRLDHPFEAARMGLGGVAAHDQDDVGVLDVLPGVGHRATTE